MIKPDDLGGFDLEVWCPSSEIELWEDNAGNLLITQPGESLGFDVTFCGKSFLKDAYSLATGKDLDNWLGDFQPVNPEFYKLVAVYTLATQTVNVSNIGTSGFLYVVEGKLG